MPIAADYPFLDVLWTIIVFFGFVIWVWLLFAIFGDLFRRVDISGWKKAGWALLVIVLPVVGVLLYLGIHGQEMGERSAEAQQAAKAELDAYVRETAGSGGPATEIAEAHRLLESGAIDQGEFERLKQRALS